MKNKKFWLNLIKKYSIIVIGCVVYSLGIALFLDPNRLAAGGVTGIAIILNHLIGGVIDTGIWIIIFNVPLLILGFFYFGKEFTFSTLFSAFVSSGFMELWTRTLVNTGIIAFDDLLLSALIGGALFGIGLGIIFRMGSTTGGTDIVIKILRTKFRHIRMGIINICIDATIILISAICFRQIILTCYTILALVVFTVSFDWVLYGNGSAKLVYIITTEEPSKKICDKILKDLDITATLLDGKGAYTGADRVIIMCAIKNILFPKLRDIVKECDPLAFTIVGSANEIYGEGFKDQSDED